ncbi:MAG TPA: ABC transporter permease subunit [Thermoanaerobaculia bacterium]
MKPGTDPSRASRTSPFAWLLRKELWVCRHDRRLFLGVLLCGVLALSSAFVRIQAYQSAAREQQAAAARWQAAVQEQIQRSENIQVESLRAVSPLSVLSVGLEPILPDRFTSTKEGLRFGEDRGARSPVDALFGTLDLAFVTGVLFSLLAVLLTFDSICGERGSGTLAVLLSYPVSRGQVLLAKVLAYLSVLSLGFIPAVLVVLLGAALAGVPTMSLAHWAAWAAAGWLYLAAWTALGVGVSARVRRPAQAVLVCIVIWVASVFLLPRGVALAVNLLNPPERLARLALQEDRENSLLRTRFHQRVNQAFGAYMTSGEDEDASREAFDKLRRSEEARLDRAREELARRLWTRMEEEERARDRSLAALSFLSPTALFQSAASELAWTGTRQRRAFYQAARDYHLRYGQKLAERQQAFFVLDAAAPQDGRAMISTKDAKPLLVPFRPPWASSSAIFASVLAPLLGLGAYTALALFFGYRAFLRLDARG